MGLGEPVQLEPMGKFPLVRSSLPSRWTGSAGAREEDDPGAGPEGRVPRSGVWTATVAQDAGVEVYPVHPQVL